MAGVRLDVDVSGALGKLGRVQSRLDSLEVPARRVGIEGEDQARQRLAERPPSTWFPQTRGLARSISSETVKQGSRLAVWIGSSLPHARIQELGSGGLPGGVVVRIPPGVYLAIPGSTKIQRSGLWPRDYPSGDLQFYPAATINIGSNSWIGPALLRRPTESRQKIIDKRHDRAKSQIAGLKSKYKRKASRERHAARIREKEAKAQAADISKLVEFALVRSVKVPAQPYLKHERTVAAVLEFTKRTIKAYLLG